MQGEGFLRVVKPSTRGIRKNWQKNLLLTIARDKAMSSVVQSLSPPPSTPKVDVLVDSESICRYGSLSDIRLSVDGRKPIGCIYLRSSRHFAARTRNGNWYILSLNSRNVFLFSAMYYYEVTLHEDPFGIGNIDSNDFSYVVLLPIRSDDMNYQGFYTAVDKEYNEIDNNMCFIKPNINCLMH